MAITLFNPQDAVKLAINQTGVNANFFSDTRYKQFVLGHALGTQTSYTFQQIGTDYAFVNGNRYCLLAPTTPYTETSGVSSTFSCGWDQVAPAVIVTAGTQTGSTLTVTATPIDWNELMADVVKTLKAHAARKEDSMSLAGAGMGYSSLMERLDMLEQQYRGAIYA